MGGQSGLRFLGGYWFLQKKCPCAVPPGLRCEFLEFGFPTLKRGATLRLRRGGEEITFAALNRAHGRFLDISARVNSCLDTNQLVNGVPTRP
jgi:hypothetical protein